MAIMTMTNPHAMRRIRRLRGAVPLSVRLLHPDKTMPLPQTWDACMRLLALESPEFLVKLATKQAENSDWRDDSMMRFWLLTQPPQFAGGGKFRFARIVAETEMEARVFAEKHFEAQEGGKGADWSDPDKTLCRDDTKIFQFPTMTDPPITVWEGN
jgi:hypothetical protein